MKRRWDLKFMKKIQKCRIAYSWIEILSILQILLSGLWLNDLIAGKLLLTQEHPIRLWGEIRPRNIDLESTLISKNTFYLVVFFESGLLCSTTNPPAVPNQHC